MLATDELGQVFLFLRIVAVAFDLIDAKVGVRTIGQAHARARSRDFFHGNHVSQITHFSTAISLRCGDAQDAQVTHLAPQVHGELIAGIDLCRTGRDLGLGKCGDRIAQRIDVFAKLEVKSR